MKKILKKIKNTTIENGKFIRRSSAIILCFVITFGIFIINCYVPSESMSPTLEVGQMYISNRLAYINKDPQRGDIVVFEAPDKEPVKYVKRIIGLPGETVTIENGKVNIDGKTLDEAYVAEGATGNYGPFYVPKKGDKVKLEDVVYNDDHNISEAACYINNELVGLVGTYESGDTDTEEVQEISMDFLKKYCKEIDGEYIVKENTYFMLGDNRNNSLDSRFWNYSYVKKDKIIAKYVFSYF